MGLLNLGLLNLVEDRLLAHDDPVTIVVRQSEERLIHFLNDIREGRCDDESSRFAAELCRAPESC